MNKMNRMKRIVTVILIAVMAAGCFTTVSFGASKATKKMTVYDILKKNNTVYCAGYNGIYKVNLLSGSVQTLYNEDAMESTMDGGPDSIYLHKGYIYFLTQGPMGGCLHRVKTSGRKYKCYSLNSTVYEYAIKKGKIYYGGYDYKTEKDATRSMNLDGRNVRKSKYRVSMKRKKTNAQGYYIHTVYNGKESKLYDGEVYWEYQYSDYLITPEGRSYLVCTYNLEEDYALEL